jgi:hypothetical protein
VAALAVLGSRARAAAAAPAGIPSAAEPVRVPVLQAADLPIPGDATDETRG